MQRISVCFLVVVALLLPFYVHAGTVQLPATGQATSYATGDDGALQNGVATPSPRFTDNGNGTVTDNLTGLVWLKNANCFGVQAWTTAIASASALANAACGLTDGSTAGQWHLPSRKELQSLVDRSAYNPALSAGHPFTSVLGVYWHFTSSTNAGNTSLVWEVDMASGMTLSASKSAGYVWPVRSGQ